MIVLLLYNGLNVLDKWYGSSLIYLIHGWGGNQKMEIQGGVQLVHNILYQIKVI